MFEYTGKPFEKGLVAYFLRLKEWRSPERAGFALSLALKELDETLGTNSVATAYESDIVCVPVDPSIVRREIPVRIGSQDFLWKLDPNAYQLSTNHHSEREIIRRLVARAIAKKQIAAGWFVESYGFAYHWSFSLSKQLYTDIMDVYPGFVFRPYVYEDGSCAVMVDPKFKFVAKRNLRDVIERLSNQGFDEERIGMLLENEMVIDTCPVVECPKRRTPASDCPLKGTGKRRRLLKLDFTKSPSQAAFGDLIEYHRNSVCRNKGLIAERLKSRPPIALVEGFGQKTCLEYPIERLREELKLQKIDRTQRALIMKYIQPSMSKRWELTDNFTAYVDDVELGRSCHLGLIRQFAEAGAPRKPWATSIVFEEPPLEFGHKSFGHDPFAGLERTGPYDISGSNCRKFDSLKIGLCNYSGELSVKRINAIYDDLCEGFARGARFVGLRKLFQLRIPSFSEDFLISDIDKIERLSPEARPDIVLVFTSRIMGNKVKEYGFVKRSLTQKGIPSQFILAERVHPSNSPDRYSSYLKNVALATYYKVGGTPWVLSHVTNRNSCYIGLAMIARGAKVYMSTQVFDSIGLWLGGWTESVDKDRYTSRLIDRINEAQEVFSKARGMAKRIVLHKDGEFWENIELQPLLENIRSNAVYVCVKKTAWPRLYNQLTRMDYMVPRGACVQIEDNAALLATSGPPHPSPGSQRPIIVEMKTKSYQYNLMDACRDIFNLSLVFGGYSLAITSKPVTTHFASKAVSLLSKYNIEESSLLWKKAWFV